MSAQYYLFALPFPHLSILWVCSSVHESRSTDLTRLICVPIPRWMPEQRMQTKIPRFQLAHLGSVYELASWLHICPKRLVRLFFLQSAQLLFTSSLTRLFSVARFCSTRLSAGFARRDMAVVGRSNRHRYSVRGTIVELSGVAGERKSEKMWVVAKFKSCWHSTRGELCRVVGVSC